MKYFLSLLMCSMWLIAGGHTALDSTALKNMARFAGNLLTYKNKFTQEKVYLHLDNNGYLAGEKIWFKAYVMNAASLLPTDMSKVLYVELVSPRGQVISRKTLPISNGRTYGDFTLDPVLCRSGYYEVRAYTRAMLNWDAAYIYSRVLPVFEEPEDTVNFSGLTVAESKYEVRASDDMRAFPQPLCASDVQQEKSLLMTFFPEGGYITQGQPSVVAFKITDEQGLPLAARVAVYSSDNSLLVSTDVVHDGMGRFNLPSTFSGGYVEVTCQGKEAAKFNLPSLRKQGATIRLESNSQESGMNVRIYVTDSLKGKALGLSVTCRGQLCFFKDVEVQEEQVINVPYDKLRDGVHQITLFDAKGEILCERMAWCVPHKKDAVMTIRQNDDCYKPFSPVVLEISLNDGEGVGMAGDFSLSVRDANCETGPSDGGLQTDMLLCSDLKGYINNPDYYFQSNDAEHLCALDLLMMVQGWRRYSWKEMAGVNPFELKQPVEDGLMLKGSANKTKEMRSALKKYGSLNLNFLLNTLNGPKTFDVPTDSVGNFAVRLPAFLDDAPSVITVTDKKDRRVYTDLKIDRNFSPSPKSYEPLAINATFRRLTDKIQALSRRADTFEWKDTIPNIVSNTIKLKEVQVMGRNEPGYHAGARYSWMGGADAAKHDAAYFYDLKAEQDRYQDDGNAIPNLWDWLKSRNPNFYCDPNGEEKTYKGCRVDVVMDNDYDETGNFPVSRELTYEMNKFKSLAIVEYNADADKLITAMASTHSTPSNPLGATIFLYSRPYEEQGIYYKRGVRQLTLHGYSTCDEFYSPDYRLQDLPNNADYRRTLYWNPSLQTDANGKANVIFYSNARPEVRLVINAQGIAVNGQMFQQK